MGIITGTAGNDVLFGTPAADLINGLGGNDYLIGDDGSDTLNGGDGNDILDGGTGDDTLNGGAGFDEAVFGSAASAVTVDLSLTGFQPIGGGLGSDKFVSIEALGDTFYNDSLSGNAADNTFFVSNGNDTINGRGGNDTLCYEFSSAVHVDLLDTNAQAVNADKTDTITGIENLIGTFGNDALFGTNGANRLVGSGSTYPFGNFDTDLLYGRGGNDVLDAQKSRIGIAGYFNSGTPGHAGVMADLLLGSATGIDGTDTLLGVDWVAGSKGNDTLLGTNAANDFWAVDGTDLIDGRGQAIDTADLALFSDFDLIPFTALSTGAVNANLSTGVATDGGTLHVTLRNIEGIIGSNTDDTITGNSGNNILGGSGGNDSIDGGGGNDTAVFRGAPGDYTIGAGTVADSVGGRDGTDTLTNIEILWFQDRSSVFNESIYRGLDPAADTNFRITPIFNAYPSFDGGTGLDTLTIDVPASSFPFGVFEFDGNVDANGIKAQNIDTTILNSNGAVSISGDFSTTGASSAPATVQPAFILNGGSSNNSFDASGISSATSVSFLGGAGNDTLRGGAGADKLNGGPGNDTMTGGGGDDVYYVDSSFDKIFEAAADGTDLVFSAINFVLPANVDNLQLTGLAVSGTGNALANTITGNAMNNVIVGAGGNDVLSGGAGADILRGGGGNDTYTIDRASDTVSELAGQGTDTVNSPVSYTLPTNVENLVLTGTGNFSGTGNGLANVITGNAGNNVLTGGSGPDALSGGGGANTFRYTSAFDGSDSISDFVAGTDTFAFKSAAFHSLPVGVLSAGNFSGTGAPTDGDDYFVFDAGTHILSYDSDGNGGAAPVAIATLTNGATISSADIVITA